MDNSLEIALTVGPRCLLPALIPPLIVGVILVITPRSFHRFGGWLTLKLIVFIPLALAASYLLVLLPPGQYRLLVLLLPWPVLTLIIAWRYRRLFRRPGWIYGLCLLGMDLAGLCLAFATLGANTLDTRAAGAGVALLVLTLGFPTFFALGAVDLARIWRKNLAVSRPSGRIESGLPG